MSYLNCDCSCSSPIMSSACAALKAKLDTLLAREGREAIAATIAWAREKVDAAAFIYPVAVQNHPSRHLAESLGGTLVGTRQLRKPSGVVLDEVVYRISI